MEVNPGNYYFSTFLRAEPETNLCDIRIESSQSGTQNFLWKFNRSGFKNVFEKL